MSPIERRLRETAIEWLMLVGEHGGDQMVPRIATMKRLQRHERRILFDGPTGETIETAPGVCHRDCRMHRERTGLFHS